MEPGIILESILDATLVEVLVDLAYFVGAAGAGVIGTLWFGRGYRKRIQDLEERDAKDDTVINVHVHGGMHIGDQVNHYYNESDRTYRADIDGKAEIVSPFPIKVRQIGTGAVGGGRSAAGAGLRNVGSGLEERKERDG